MNLKSRVEALERETNIEEREPHWLILKPAAAKITQEEIRAAQEEYKRSNPDWPQRGMVALAVGYEPEHPVIQLIGEMRRGEWPTSQPRSAQE